jgi:hypothetical protein
MRNVLSSLVVILPLVAIAQPPNTEALLQQAQETVDFKSIQADTEGFLAELSGSANFATEFKPDAAERRLKRQDFRGQEDVQAIAKKSVRFSEQGSMANDKAIARAATYDLGHIHRQLATKIKALELFKEDEKNDEIGSAIEQLNMLDKMVSTFDGKIPKDPDKLRVFAGTYRRARIKKGRFKKDNDDLQYWVDRGFCTELREVKKSRLLKSKKVYKHYCCFASKFSKLVREGLDAQGLTSLGDGEVARCGTSIEVARLAELDWSQLNLSELITDDGSELQSHVRVKAITPVKPATKHLAAAVKDNEEECDPVEMEKKRWLTVSERVNKMRKQKKGEDDE